jgi:hypothetical protein
MPVSAPVLVADDDSSFIDAQPPPLHDNATSILSTAPSIVSPPGGSSLDISLLATQLWALADSVHSMTSPPLVSSILPSTSLAPSQPIPAVSSSPLSSPDNAILHVTLLSTMLHDSILKLLHHADFLVPPFVHVIPPIIRTQRHIGLLKSSIVSWAVNFFVIINTSCRSVVMVNKWTVENSHPLLGPLLISLKRMVVGHETAQNTNFWTLFTWTLHLVIAYLSAVFDML